MPWSIVSGAAAMMSPFFANQLMIIIPNNYYLVSDRSFSTVDTCFLAMIPRMFIRTKMQNSGSSHRHSERSMTSRAAIIDRYRRRTASDKQKERRRQLPTDNPSGATTMPP
ncbi:hypothetical protein [Paraburkholderia sediminicola]|uniref:hypothetical protein n=1 Tax=Paraburkholderia sediminicola TaxID=458836 RepID=UPI0038BC1D40